MAKKLMKKYQEGSVVKTTTPTTPVKAFVAPKKAMTAAGHPIVDKDGNPVYSKKTGGVVKNKTGNAASRGLMKKGGSTKSKKKC